MPFERSVIESYPARSDWDAEAADLTRAVLERWHLSAGEAFVGGEAAATLRVTTRDGSPAVLKVGFPHVEATHEAVALEAWSSTGLAPAVLRQDPWTWSMLLEEVRPGVPLSSSEVHEALDAAAGLLARLHATASPPGTPALEHIMREYIAHARAVKSPDEPVTSTRLVERGLDEAERLLAETHRTVLLHGDFNPGNVLASAEGSWVAIDPKPMVGDPAFDLFPLSEQLGDLAGAPGRLRAASSIIECDPHRAIRWAFVRSALNVSWYLSDGDRDTARAAASEAAMWLELSES